MINLRVHTEFSFRFAYGPLPLIVSATNPPAIAITDRNGTWGLVNFDKECKKQNRKPIFGVELAVVERLEAERHPANWMAFLARNTDGLKELFELTTESTSDENFYYFPRISYERLKSISDNIAILSGQNPRLDLFPRMNPKNFYAELNPACSTMAGHILKFAKEHSYPIIASSDNYFPRPEHRQIYEIIAGRNRDMKTTPMHLLDEWEWRMHFSRFPEDVLTRAVKATHDLAAACNATLPKARMVKYQSSKTLEQLCREAAPSRRVNLKDPVYAARLKRELDLIAEKDFADYFFVIADMLKYAKQHMLVGPARGSSCGSLVCYLLSITEIDPIPFNLLFERFIDVNRKDLPDIDIDFADNRRDMVFDYIANKYGKDCVARLGTVSRYQAKSAIDAVAISLRIPVTETENLKNSILERSGGDARAAFCILDTFNELEIGKEMLLKYPHLRIAADIEDHASNSGQHAAGVVITAEPISHFCALNLKNGVAMVDKKDAESINLLKIDALGLRTLSVIQDCLDQVNLSREWLLTYPLDDADAFAVVNDSRFAGIFQFEGYALQSLAQQMDISNFNDIAALGALARPGPLNSGGANEYIKRRIGQSPVVYLHPMLEDITRVSYGVVIYQEQVMNIARVMGRLSWEDVSSLRKAMSKSLGQEFFDQYWVRFLAGAQEQGVTEEEARNVWEQINVMGSWSFNQSHAVAYGLVSYWCMVLKAKFPLEWAAACLRNSSNNDQCIKLLRELDKEGYRYQDFDYEKSDINWSVRGNELLGGLLNIVGIGESKARGILDKRKKGEPLTPALEKKLREGVTPFAYQKVFQCRTRFKSVLEDPGSYNIERKIWNLGDITSNMEGEFLFFGKLVKKDLRDLNEPFFVQKRGHELAEGQLRLFLNMVVEDDTSNILISISKNDYPIIGTHIYQSAQIGDWYLWKGNMRYGFRKIYIKRYLSEEQILRNYKRWQKKS